MKEVLLDLNMTTPETWKMEKPLSDWEHVKVDKNGNVEELDLSNSGVKMDISELGIILGPKLKVLIFQEQANVKGDISILEKTPNIEVLRALRSGLSGDILVLRKCPKFQLLDCQSTKICGSVAVFKYCPDAKYCRYWGSGITRPNGCPSGQSLGCQYADQYTSKEQMDGLRDWLNKN